MIISTNHQAKLNLERSTPYKWKLNSATFCLLGGIVFLGGSTVALYLINMGII
jgi:hypothetical protein